MNFLRKCRTFLGRNWHAIMIAGVLIIAVALLMAYCQGGGEDKKEDTITYSQFMDEVEAGKVESIKVTIGEGDVYGKYKEDFEGKPHYFRTVVSPEFGEDFYKGEIEEKYGVEVEFEKSRGGGWTGLILNFLPLIFIGFFLWFFLFRRGGMGGAGVPIGKRKISPQTSNETFDDVAGVEEAKEELKEIVEFLKNPEKFTELGAKIPKGALLMGPPGTGKTLLARAVAGEANVPFFSISGSEFVELFVGMGASRVRNLFDQAKKAAPCIVFIDEIDAVGRHRGAGIGGGHDEREQTLNQILNEMDGFEANQGVIVLAATNRPDILDPAILRPGRFDRQVVLDAPDIKGREAILKVHARGKPLEEDVNLEIVAKQTPGFSGADLANVLNEAAILAVRRGKKKISMEEINEGVDRTIAGPERKSRVISEEERKKIAYHEAGHALVGEILPEADPPYKITIVARGLAGGFTRFIPEEERHLFTCSQLEDMLAMILGGYTAEEIVFGEASSGAQNDIERATKLVREMVMRYGMSKRLGVRSFGKRQELVFLGKEISEQRDYSDSTAKEIDEEIRHFMEGAQRRARGVVEEHREKLDAVVKELLEKETLEGEELRKLLKELGL